MQAFAEQGLDAPSLDAICERAGYTRGAFYVHFKDRDDLIVAVMERTTLSFLSGILGAEDQPLDVESIVRLFSEAVATGAFPFASQVRPHQFVAACMRSSKLRAGYLAMVERAAERVARSVKIDQRQNRLRSDVRPEDLARMLIAVVMGVETMSDLGVPFDARTLARLILKLLEA